MACETCGEFPYSLAGRVIKGRSTPQYDKRIRSQPVYHRSLQTPFDHTMGPPALADAYYGGQLPQVVQRMKHYGTYSSDVPMKPSPHYGEPFTDAERMERHQSIYGNTTLPPRGTGRGVNLGRGVQRLAVDWGTLLGGVIIGLIFGYFVFTSSGRRIGYSAGKRAARRIG